MRSGAATAGQTEGASDPWHIRVVTRDTIPQFWSRATRLHPTDSWPLHQQPLNPPLRFATTVYLLRLTGNGKISDRRHGDAQGAVLLLECPHLGTDGLRCSHCTGH